MNRREFWAGTLATCSVSRAAFGEALALERMQWTGKTPAFPLFRARARGEFSGDVDVRIATKSDPVRYRSFLAFYRLADALGSKLVPRTAVYAVKASDLLPVLKNDVQGYALLRDDLVIMNDGTVTVLVSNPIPGARDIDFVNGAEVKVWRALAEGRANVAPERRAFAGAYVEALVLDYLAANGLRTVASRDASAKTLYLVENGTAFPDLFDPARLDFFLSGLKRIAAFPKGLVERLRAFDKTRAELELHGGSFSSWLLPSRPLVEMLERREAVLSLVSARVTELGQTVALGFP